MEEILIRVLQGRATPAEAETLLRWRKADPENERRYQEITRLWNGTGLIDAGAARRSPPSAFEIIRAAKQRQLPASAADRARPAVWRLWAGRAAAAIALLVAGFGISQLLSPPALFAGGVVSTNASEMATVTLADGSVVRLGPKSRLRFGKEPERREVWLDGHAFFSVAPMEDRPFTVRTVAGKAVALGTRFQVRTSEEAMQVGVIEGRVILSTEEVSRELIGGEIAHVAGENLSVRRARNPDELRPQLGNFLAFRSTPLWTVIEEVRAHFGLSVEIRDAELGGRTVTASFQDASFPEVLSVICRITVSHCEIAGSGATIGEAPVR